MRLFSRPGRVDATRAAELLERAEAVVLDVRENVEWKAGRIPGALHIPLARIWSRRHELPRDTTIITVCRSGHRSGGHGRKPIVADDREHPLGVDRGNSSLAARWLRHAGYHVEDLEGGMKAWARARLPLDPPGGRVL